MQQPPNENQDVPWGGKRTGAGRKAPPTGKLELLAVRISPTALKNLQAEAERRGVSLREVIEGYARKLPEAGR